MPRKHKSLSIVVLCRMLSRLLSSPPRLILVPIIIGVVSSVGVHSVTWFNYRGYVVTHFQSENFPSILVKALGVNSVTRFNYWRYRVNRLWPSEIPNNTPFHSP